MIDSLDLNVCKGSLAISIPSMIILPIQKKMDSLLDCLSCHTAAGKDMAQFQLQYSTTRTGLELHTSLFTNETSFG